MNRWNNPKSFSAKRMSKPAPLSRTKNVRTPDSSRAANSMRTCGVRAENFQALPSRFCSTSRNSVLSPSARKWAR
jgi:hypothetical protein